MDNKLIAGAIIGAVVIGAGGFYAGMKYGSSAGRAGARGQGQFFAAGANGGQRTGRFAQGEGMIFGTILGKDGESLTLSLGAGTSTQGSGSKIILYGKSTQVGKFSVGSAEDLAVGDTVSVQGAQNPDGSLTAQMIQIRPAGMGFSGRPQ